MEATFKVSCTSQAVVCCYKVGEKDENGNVIDQDRAGLFGLISDECKLRMSDPAYLSVTSKLYIGSLGCKYDDVNVPFMNDRLHKEKIGIMIVIIDFARII